MYKHVRAAHFILKASLILGMMSPSISFAKTKKKAPEPLAALRLNKKSEKGNDLKSLKAELFIAAQEDKAIAQLNSLLKKYKNTPLEADLLMRLGELYVRRAKTDRFLEVHRTSEELVSIVPKLAKSAASKKQMQKAIDIFDAIEKRFPNFDKLDMVLYNNAFACQQIGNSKRAEQQYSKLVRHFQNSVLLPDAHLALGEIQFQNRNFKKALEHFRAIREFPDSIVYPYGMYKAGWTYFNLHENQMALKELEDVVKYGRFVQARGIDSRLDIRKEALMDMALFYEDSFPAKGAYAYFEKQAADLDVSPFVLRLSELYKRHSRHADVRLLLTEYIKKQPTSNLLPTAYVEMMDASEKMKIRKDVVVLLGRLSSLCEPDSNWSKAQAKADLSAKPEGHQDVLACRATFHRIALGYANKWLKVWNADPSQTELADATEKAFAIYLQSEKRSEETGRARYVYAELLFKRGKFAQASQNYAQSALDLKEPSMTHDARYYALAALEKSVGDKWNANSEAQFTQLAKDYLQHNPKGKYALDVEFKRALIAYENGRYDESSPVFKRLGQMHPDSDKGIKSQDLLLDTLNIKKEYEDLRDYALEMRAKAKGDRQLKLSKIYEETSFLIIQKYEADGNIDKAISGYKAFANSNPTSALSQKALWNALQLHYKSNDLVGGARAGLEYYEKYPQSKEGLDVLMKSAQTLEAVGQLTQAAQVLSRLAVVDSAQHDRWMLLAADFYNLENETKKAKAMYLELKKSGDAKTSQRALEQLEKIALIDGDVGFREVLLSEMLKKGQQPQASKAQLYFAQKAYDSRQWDDAFNLAKKVIGQDKNGAAKSDLAQARYIQAMILSREFRDQSVRSKIERVQTVLTLKTEKLSKAQVALQSAANYGDPIVAVKAYKELADCYMHYSDALRGMPVPKGLPDTEAQAFRDEMQKLAIPMEEKGIETKIMALKAAQELGAADEIVVALQKELKDMNQTVASGAQGIRVRPAAIVVPNLQGAKI